MGLSAGTRLGLYEIVAEPPGRIILAAMTGTQILINLLGALIVAVVSAVLTVRLSLRRFYSERWWERKAEAYTKLIEALYAAKHWPETYLESVEGGYKLDAAKAEELRLQCLSSEDEIRKWTAIGAFVISEDAVRCLEGLATDLEHSKNCEPGKSYELYCKRNVAAFNSCLETLREYAKKDLRVG